MCLSACHYDHATDVHKKLAVMAKCESSELSRCRSSPCPAYPHMFAAHRSRLGALGACAERLTFCSRLCAPPGITFPTRTVVLQIRTTATSTLWDVAANTAPTISRGDR